MDLLTRDSRSCPMLSLALPSVCTGKDILYLSPEPPYMEKKSPLSGCYLIWLRLSH